MPDIVQRFDGRAADYDRYRERYDTEELLTLLRDWCRLTPEWLIADVGAGTGMLADVFLANGNHVIAIEPNTEMRSACARLHPHQPRLEIREGIAEATRLPDASIDMVCSGRALHWFDLEAAMREFRRIVRPGGWVVSAAAGRTEFGRDENDAFAKLIERYSDSAYQRPVADFSYMRIKSFFEGGEFHHYEHGGRMRLDWERLRGMTLSLSRAPRAGDPHFAAFEQELREFYNRYARDGFVTLETRCWLNAGRF
ncbi:MAG TPA: class I SAM-dependent methyltransferase [Bryocella sp.]|nr:class I SAM-dependent methyltransferase [Bryocella sp.]